MVTVLSRQLLSECVFLCWGRSVFLLTSWFSRYNWNTYPLKNIKSTCRSFIDQNQTIQCTSTIAPMYFIVLMHTYMICRSVFSYMNCPGGSDGKASAYNVGDVGSIPGSGRSPGEGNGTPLQYSCLENPHGWRSLVGYSPCGHKESDTTERLHFTFSYIQ